MSSAVPGNSAQCVPRTMPKAAAVILAETMRMKELVDTILTISRLVSHDLGRTEVISPGSLWEQIDHFTQG